MILLDYHIIPEPYQKPNYFFSHLVGEKVQGDQAVWIKLCNPGSHYQLATQTLQREAEVLRRIKGDPFPKILESATRESLDSIVFQPKRGISLSEFRQKNNLHKSEIIGISLQILDLIDLMQEKGVLHLSIQPDKLYWDSETRELHIVGFEYAEFLRTNGNKLARVPIPEEINPWMAPEQTGKLKLHVDLRTDLYGLGSTIYFLLTGKPPFSENDPLRLAHRIVASTLEERPDNHKFPVLLGIVQRLMAKSPDARYQSIKGLRKDLEQLFSMEQSSQVNQDFKIGQYDIKPSFQLNNQLYGRTEDLKQLEQALEDVGEKGKSLVLIKGPSGIGKSALVEDFLEHRKLKNGFAIKGEFEEHRLDRPYQGWMKAFSELLNEILTLEHESVEDWRSKLQSVFDGNVALFKDALPKLNLLVEEERTPGEIQPAYLKSRFQIILKDFIRLFCELDAPLVIFLDNIHWANASSIEFLHILLEDPTIKGLMLILGITTSGESEKKNIVEGLSTELPVSSLHLSPLNQHDIGEWLQGSFGSSLSNTQALIPIALEKTQGNPFYLKAWMSEIFREDLIAWNAEKRSWNWDQARIQDASIPEDMTGLLMNNVNRLPKTALDLLHIASCLGNGFKIEELSNIGNESIPKVSQSLLEAETLQIIRKTKNRLNSRQALNGSGQAYVFSHNKIRSALYKELPTNLKSRVHLQYGLELLSKNRDADDEEGLFLICSHLVNAQNIEIPEENRSLAIRSLLKTGKKVMQTGDFEQAITFFRQAEFWSDQGREDFEPKLLVDLYSSMGESYFLSGNMEEGEQYFERAEKASSDPYVQAKIMYAQMGLYNYFEDLESVKNKGFRGLELLNEPFNTKLDTLNIIRGLVPILLKIGPKAAERIANSPKRAPKEKALAINILIELTEVVHNEHPNYPIISILGILNLTRKYGLAEGSGFGFAALGGVHFTFLNSVEKGLYFWDLALKMIDVFPNNPQKGRVQFVIYGATKYQVFPIKHCLINLQEIYKNSAKGGDMYWAYASLAHSSYFMLNAGNKLSNLASYLENSMKIHFPRRGSHKDLSFSVLRMIQTYVLTLLNRNPVEIGLGHFASIENSSNNSVVFLYHALKTFIAFYEGALHAAIEHGNKAVPYHQWSIGNSLHQDFVFVHAVILAEFIGTDQALNKSQSLKAFGKYYRQMKGISKKGPENYKAKELILQGLDEYLKKRKGKAIETFIRAKFIALENSLLPDAALAAEWAGKLKLELGEKIGASGLLQEAHVLYLRWENVIASNRLKHTYPGLIFGSLQEGQDEGISELTKADQRQENNQSLNLTTIERVSTVLASERYQKPLLEKFLSLIMEHAGASAAAYFSYSKENFWLEAQADLNRPYQSQDDLVVLGQTQEFPRKIIRYVGRAQEYLVIDHPDTDPRFADDAYLQENPPLSVLCYPLVHAGKLQGILYAENKFIPGAFSQDNLQLLKLISGQMSLSIENAQANELLEDKVKERTIALAKEQERSEGLLLNILPEQVAEELKEKNKATPRYYAEATVLFTDFVGFTKQSEQLSPQELVSLLDEYFSHFDQICAKYNIEKIKTIGDAFLCVGGLPTVDPDHAIKVAKAALEMRDYVREKQSGDQANTFDIRLGIHTGPLIAGVVGIKKFSYDIWGDTVNIASRMESNSEAGKINISASTYERIQDQFRCKYRGKIEAKGKGLIDMYYLEEVK